MKKYLITAIVLMLSTQMQAQDDFVITGSKKISKQLTPQQVVDSLNKQFPNAKAVEYYQAPADAVRNGWTINVDDNLDGDLDFYEVSFKNNNLKYYALYNKDGSLVKSRIQETSTNLPEPIKASLMNLKEQYPGYTVVSKTYYKNQNYTKSKEYYEVVAKKGNAKKTLYYSPDGTIVKEK